MINLSQLDLIPFKTKGITRSGQRVIYIGKNVSESMWPYSFGIKDPRRAQGSILFITNAGHDSADGTETPNDIVRIISTWEPRRGDIVKVNGNVIKLNASGGFHDYAMVLESSVAEYKVEDPHIYANEFFNVTRNDGSPTQYRVFGKNMRLIRRP